MDVSFQLYSSREVPSQIEFLKDLAQLGYTQVEGYGGVYGEPDAFRSAMDEVGITMPSGHFGIDAMESDLEGQLSLATTLGIKHIYVPFLAAADRPKGSAGYLAFAKRLEALNSKVRDQGFDFGWHNHDFELIPLADGGVPLDILLTEAPGISWEGDLAWIIVGKGDAFQWVGEFGSRLTSVHVKDIAPAGENTNEDGWADVGEGTVDWQALTDKVRSASPDSLMVMEHDKPSDAKRFASTAIANFKSY